MDLKKMPDSYWKEKLSSEQFAVCRLNGTESPFSGKYNDHYESGVYKCVACGSELFKSDDKFKSGSGWPSFSEAMDSQRVELVEDYSHGMSRVEVKCATCGSHLGHVFDDGPAPSGKRFCINSVALDFSPDKA
jgi:peptide-methionine (R)-S-oxide reductase